MKCDVRLIYPVQNPEYKADILMRLYPDQNQKHTATDFVDGWYCGDVYCRNGTSSKYAGQISCNHPQGLQWVLESLIKEQSENSIIIEIENGFTDGRPHPDCRDRDWLDRAINNAIRGDFKNADMAPGLAEKSK
jgi:hypothetical protein